MISRKVSSIFFALLIVASLFVGTQSAMAGDLADSNVTIAVAPARPFGGEDACKFLNLSGSLFKSPVKYLGCRILEFLNETLFTPVVAFACLMTNSMLVSNFDPNIRTGYDTVKGTCRIYD